MDVTDVAQATAALASAELKEKQGPLKERYRANRSPRSSRSRPTASWTQRDRLQVRTSAHWPKRACTRRPAVTVTQLCSGDMLLEALVACAGVTLRAVATSLGMAVRGTVHAEGDLDFRGTLGVAKDAPVASATSGCPSHWTPTPMRTRSPRS